MSTRAQIGFYDQPLSGSPDMATVEAEPLIYRHSDGYPGSQTEGGVLPEILPFLKWFTAERGWDAEYLSARLLGYLIREHDTAMVKYAISAFGGLTGFGISKGIHGDIEYFYAVSPNLVQVYTMRGDTLTLVQAVHFDWLVSDIHIIDLDARGANSGRRKADSMSAEPDIKIIDLEPFVYGGAEFYIVVCRDDMNYGVRGEYVLATRQTFATLKEAARYAVTVNESREPLVVSGRFGQLRPPRLTTHPLA
jgi:hypothetical protein